MPRPPRPTFSIRSGGPKALGDTCVAANCCGSMLAGLRRRQFSMGAFLYTCPATGMKVHGWTAEEAGGPDHYETVECTACKRLHLVNPRTGRVAGASRNGSSDTGSAGWLAILLRCRLPRSDAERRADCGQTCHETSRRSGLKAFPAAYFSIAQQDEVFETAIGGWRYHR